MILNPVLYKAFGFYKNYMPVILLLLLFTFFLIKKFSKIIQ